MYPYQNKLYLMFTLYDYCCPKMAKWRCVETHMLCDYHTKAHLGITSIIGCSCFLLPTHITHLCLKHTHINYIHTQNSTTILPSTVATGIPTGGGSVQPSPSIPTGSFNLPFETAWSWQHPVYRYQGVQ